MIEQKSILLIPNQQPQFIGNWTVGEIRQMAQGLLMWLDAVPLNTNQPEPVKIEEKQAEK